MALKDRLARIEGNAKVSPQLSAATWWEQLLAKPKENEHRICAATMMAFDCIVQTPPPRVWASIEAIYKQDFEKLTDAQYVFGTFYALVNCSKEEEAEAEEEFKEIFGEDDGKEWLCHMAVVYWATFKEAPLVPMPQVEKDGAGRLRVVMRANLRGDFLIPLFKRIFTDEGSHRYGRFEEWLEQDGETESLLCHARAFMGVSQGVTT